MKKYLFVILSFLSFNLLAEDISYLSLINRPEYVEIKNGNFAVEKNMQMAENAVIERREDGTQHFSLKDKYFIRAKKNNQSEKIVQEIVVNSTKPYSAELKSFTLRSNQRVTNATHCFIEDGGKYLFRKRYNFLCTGFSEDQCNNFLKMKEEHVFIAAPYIKEFEKGHESIDDLLDHENSDFLKFTREFRQRSGPYLSHDSHNQFWESIKKEDPLSEKSLKRLKGLREVCLQLQNHNKQKAIAEISNDELKKIIPASSPAKSR